MPEITNLTNRDQLRAVRAKMAEALELAAEDLGVAIQIGTISYEPDGDRCTAKVEVSLPNAETEIAKAWRAIGEYLDGPFTGREVEEQTTFECRGETYQIVGLNRRARKKPIIAKRLPNGEKYNFPVVVVAKALGSRGERAAS